MTITAKTLEIVPQAESEGEGAGEHADHVATQSLALVTEAKYAYSLHVSPLTLFGPSPVLFGQASSETPRWLPGGSRRTELEHDGFLGQGPRW